MHYEIIKPAASGHQGARGSTNAVLRHDVKLKPGVNVITVFAREDDEFAQRETLTVFSKKGDPLAEKR